MIGASAQPTVFTEQVLRKMALLNQRPVIFALSNPTSKAECSATQAYFYTEGRAIFASGSPFSEVPLPDNRTLYPGQGNNVYVYPAVACATVFCQVSHIPERTFLIAALALAQLVTDQDLERGSVYPSINQIGQCSVYIATKVAEWFYQQKLAKYQPEPVDKRAFLISKMYDPLGLRLFHKI